MSPDEPYAKHRQLFRITTGDYADVEVWSRAMGKKAKTSRVPKFQKFQRNQRSKKWEKTTFTVLDLNIRMGGRFCDYGYDGALQKLGFFWVALTVQGTNANQAKLEDRRNLRK